MKSGRDPNHPVDSLDRLFVPERLSPLGRQRLALARQLADRFPSCLAACIGKGLPGGMSADECLALFCVEGFRAAFSNGRKTVLCVANTHLWAHFGNLPALIRQRGHNCLVVSTTPGETNPFNEPVFHVDLMVLKRLDCVHAAICCFLKNPFLLNPPPFPVIGLNHQTTSSIDSDITYWFLHFDYYMCNLSKTERASFLPLFENNLNETYLPRDVIGNRRALTLLPVGCPKIDRIAACRSALSAHEFDRILVCPSAADLVGYWVPTLGQRVITSLLEQFPSHRIVFRPKPEDRERPEIKAVVEAFKGRDRFEYDASSDYVEPYARGALMITDSSDTGTTFSLASLRPTLYFVESTIDRKIYPWLDKERPGGMNVGSIDELLRAATAVVDDPTRFEREIQAYKEDFICNPGYSVERFLDYLDAVIEDKVHRDWLTYRLPVDHVLNHTAGGYHRCFLSLRDVKSTTLLVQSYLKHMDFGPMPEDVLFYIVDGLFKGNYHQGSLRCYFELACRQLRHFPDNVNIRRVVVTFVEKIMESNIDELKSYALQVLVRTVNLLHPPRVGSALEVWIAKVLDVAQCKTGVHRLALFGAGAHTRWLRENVRLPWGLTVTVIADDRDLNEPCFDGISVCKPVSINRSEFDAVVLSSDCRQSVFRRRCAEVWGTDVTVIDLYEGLPPGPYPKRAGDGSWAGEKELIAEMAGRFAVMTLELLHFRAGVRRIALFGAGKHSQKLRRFVPSWAALGLELVAVLDDQLEGKQDPWGLEVSRAEDFDVRRVEAVVLSTDGVTSKWAERCRTLWGERVPLVELYAGFIPGPYGEVPAHNPGWEPRNIPNTRK